MNETTAPRYTTRNDAIQWIILDALNAGELIATAEIDYDIEKIAGQVIESDETGFWQCVDVEEFWAIVADAARYEDEICEMLLADPTAVLEGGERLPDGIVIDNWKGERGEFRAIAPAWYVTREGREEIVPASWYNSEWGQQDGCGERVCAHTVAEADDARELVTLIRKVADDGKTDEDYIAAAIQEHVNELVKEAPLYTEAKVLNAPELACEPHLCAEGDHYTVCVWWWYEGRDITAERDITREQYDAYLADLTADEYDDED